VNKLVCFEETHDVRAVIAREKEIKKWRREKKINLVVAVNPEWKDLSDGWFEISPYGRDDNKDEGLAGNRNDCRDDNRNNGRDDIRDVGRDDL